MGVAQDTLKAPTEVIPAEVLKQEISAHQKAIDSLSKQLKVFKDSREVYPLWTTGGGLLSGFNVNNFNNWANRGPNINSSAASFSMALNGYANMKGKNHFWRNQARVNVGWQRFKASDDVADEDARFEKIADMLRFVTHYGHNICSKVALSAITEWESNLIDQMINPSYLDLSLGVTWTPEQYFVSVMHPVSYELALSQNQNFRSSVGAKLVVEYNRKVEGNINVQSNFSGFLSYEQLDILSNFTWSNGFNVKLFKGLGMGLEYALRVSRQETRELNLNDDHLQSYLVMGMTFEIP